MQTIIVKINNPNNEIIVTERISNNGNPNEMNEFIEQSFSFHPGSQSQISSFEQIPWFEQTDLLIELIPKHE